MEIVDSNDFIFTCYQAFKLDPFVRIVNGFKLTLLTILARISLVDI